MNDMNEEKTRQLEEYGFEYNPSSNVWFFNGDLKIYGDFQFSENFLINGNFEVTGSCCVRDLKIFSDFERVNKRINQSDSQIELPLFKVGGDLHVVGNLEAFIIEVSQCMEVLGICNAVDITAKKFILTGSVSSIKLKNIQ